MPIQKFRSFEMAREALWSDPHEAGYYQRLAWLWAFSDWLCPRTFPRGVYRFRSIEEANEQRLKWESGEPPTAPDNR